MKLTYFNTRLDFSKKRKILWKALNNYFFKKYIPENSVLLELGAGYCDFINSVKAKRKVAIDISKDMKKFASPDVEFFCRSIVDLNLFEDNEFYIVFSSNVFEHLNQEEVSLCFKQIFLKIKKDGLLIILQPNFRYSYAEYFDDYTHKSIWSDRSLNDFLVLHGFAVVKKYPKFLPLTIKSHFPTLPFLIRLYINSPVKFFGKQMLFIAKKV
jgi:ubiquinone/menaquinone biosynthesis C-methylase UbiE